MELSWCQIPRGGSGVKSEVRSWKWEVVSGAMGLMGVLRLRED